MLVLLPDHRVVAAVVVAVVVVVVAASIRVVAAALSLEVHQFVSTEPVGCMIELDTLSQRSQSYAQRSFTILYPRMLDRQRIKCIRWTRRG